MPIDTSSADAIAIWRAQEGLCRLLIEAPPREAIGAALAFLLHSAESSSPRLQDSLRAALNAPVQRGPLAARIIDVLDLAARRAS